MSQTTCESTNKKTTCESRQSVEMSALSPRAPPASNVFSSFPSSSSSLSSPLLQTWNCNFLRKRLRKRKKHSLRLIQFLTTLEMLWLLQRMDGWMDGCYKGWMVRNIFWPLRPLLPPLLDVRGSRNSYHTPDDEDDDDDDDHHDNHYYHGDDDLVRCKAGESVPTEELAARAVPKEGRHLISVIMIMVIMMSMSMSMTMIVMIYIYIMVKCMSVCL